MLFGTPIREYVCVCGFCGLPTADNNLWMNFQKGMEGRTCSCTIPFYSQLDREYYEEKVRQYRRRQISLQDIADDIIRLRVESWTKDYKRRHEDKKWEQDRKAKEQLKKAKAKTSTQTTTKSWKTKQTRRMKTGNGDKRVKAKRKSARKAARKAAKEAENAKKILKVPPPLPTTMPDFEALKKYQTPPPLPTTPPPLPTTPPRKYTKK